MRGRTRLRFLFPALAVAGLLRCGGAAAPEDDADAVDASDGAEPETDAPSDVPGEREDTADAEAEAVPPDPCLDAPPLPDAPWSATFFVVGDTHCDPTPDPAHVATAAAIARVAAEGTWPELVGGEPTGFAPEPIGAPDGVVFVGDITGSGDTMPWSDELATFRRFFQAGEGAESIAFPAYVGLGNHDLDRDGLAADAYREAMWAYVAGRHRGPEAPVPVGCFEPASSCFSWDRAGVHLVQTHKFAGDVSWGHASGLDWLAGDLAARASDGRPVVLFQHYGLDAFGTEDRWWTDADRAALDEVLAPYHVVALVAGHSHFAMTYLAGGRRVIQVNNAKAELDAGNRDGNGSFAVVRITDSHLDMVTCRWRDESGAFDLVAPWLHEPIE